MITRTITRQLTARLAALLAIAWVLPAHAAGNLLINGDAESSTGWTSGQNWSHVEYNWQANEIPPAGEQTKLLEGNWDGTKVFKVGHINGGLGSTNTPPTSTGGGYWFQDVGAAPGAEYTLTCDAGVQDWWILWAQIELVFLDAASNVVGSNGVPITKSLHAEFNGGTNLLDVGVVMQRWTNTATAPEGTAKVRVRLADYQGPYTNYTGGNVFFDNVELTSPVIPPVIADVYPNVLLAATNTLSFTASSAAGITNVSLLLNGVDVSAELVIAGTANNWTVLYTNLQPNTVYTASVSATDSAGVTSSLTVSFDTVESIFTWEAEDWDYWGGQYVSPWSPCAYAGLNGYEGTDFHDVNNQGNHPYRSDAMSADFANDISRTAFIGTNDYAVGYFGVSEWVNHTRDYPAGTYNVYGRFAAGDGTSYMSLSQVTNGTATSLGTFTIVDTGGWSTYGYVPLRDNLGNLVELTVPSSGPLTMRLTHTGGSDANVNFLMLTPARTDLPIISQVYPDGTLLLQATNSFRFTASNPTVPIYSTNINLTLDGVDVTSQLTISGAVNSWNVSVPLALNVARYTAVITVQDANTNVASATIYFDTFQPTNFTWEAEDYDFNSGSFIDNPVPTSGTATDSYFGRLSTPGVDFFQDYYDPAAPFAYYYRDLPIDVCGDYPPLASYVTAQLADPEVKDHNLAYWATNAWANYTHTYPAGTYQIYGRLASGPGSSVQLDEIAGAVTNHLGQFNVPNWGWGIYAWWPLVDGNGQSVTVSLGGTNTLRATTDGNANANRFMLVTPLAAATSPQITATTDSGSVVLSFPTQSGHAYQVWGKDNLNDTDWTLLGTVAGNDAVTTWSEPATQAHRFYRLIVQ